MHIVNLQASTHNQKLDRTKEYIRNQEMGKKSANRGMRSKHQKILRKHRNEQSETQKSNYGSNKAKGKQNNKQLV